MINHDVPVNRQAAIFLSRKRRVETVREALERFAARLTEPEVAENIVKMMEKSANGDPSSLSMRVTIHRDRSTPNCFVAKLKTSIITDLGEEHYLGLK